MSWLKWNGDDVIRKIDEAMLKAKIDTGEIVLASAKQQVPLDEGLLLRSGIILIVNDSGEQIVVISFGGGAGTGHPKIPYAIRWHENSANFQHGRKRFYLKDPLYQVGPEAYKKALMLRLGNIL